MERVRERGREREGVRREEREEWITSGVQSIC